MHFASYYRWLVIREWVRVNPLACVLDVGCDDGEIVARICARIKVGIDLNPRCTDRSVFIICGDARFLPIASGRFDTVFAFDVIEHIVDDHAVMRELMRVLTEDGTLWLSTPSAKFQIFPRALTARANRGWGHVRNGYTVEEIRAMLPPATIFQVMEWNAPFFRFMQIPLRILDELSTSLTRFLAGVCFQLDRRFQKGLNGYLFISIKKRKIR